MKIANKMFRVQDKESELVLESKDRYKRLMLEYLKEKVYSEKTAKIKVCLRQEKVMSRLKNGKIGMRLVKTKQNGLQALKINHQKFMEILMQINQASHTGIPSSVTKHR